jgi:hypothetical protein
VNSPSQQAFGEKPLENSSASEKLAGATGVTKPTGELFSQSEMAMLETLKKADQVVRAHEMAHLSAAGGFAKGGATFKMHKGPDGKSYAVGGEVQIDMSPAATPEMTMQKMRIVRRAALAPVDPSPQDQRVAAQATINIAEASQQLDLEKVQGGDVKGGQGRQADDEQDRLSVGSIYQNYGKNLVSGVDEQKSATGYAAQRNIARYGEVASFSRSSGESALAIIA